MTTLCRKYSISLLSLIIAGAACFSFEASSSTPVAHAADFNANQLVSNVVFTAKDAMSVNDIQNFLVSKGSVLARLSPSDLGVGANGRSAAQIIWDASRSSISDYGCGGTPPSSCPGRPSNPFTVSLNPQVILATLQKEQSLILSTAYQPGTTTTNNALRAAMGMACFDSSACDSTYYGFTNQVTMGAATLWLGYWRAQSPANYSNTTPDGLRVGDVVNFTTSSRSSAYCSGDSRFSNVTIANAATASLYRYTTGCNGNYNFWFYMNKWFSPVAFNPTLLRDPSTGAIYATIDSVRYPIDSMETFLALGLSESNVRNITADEATAYPVGPLIKRLLLDTHGSISYLINGKRHPIASKRTFELRFRWSDVSPANPIADYLPYNLPYYELAKAPDAPAIYIMTNGRGYAFPDPETYANDWGFAWDDFATTPAYTFDPYPLDGTVSKFVKGSGPAVYVMDGGKRLPIQSADVFNNWKFDWSKINQFDDRFVGEFPGGQVLTRLAKGSGPAVYYIDNGTKRPINSASAFTKNGFKWPDVIQVSDRLLSTLPTGSVIK